MENPVPSAITGIDHVGLVSRNLKATEAAYRRLGFAVTTPKPLMAVGPDGKPRPLGQSSQHFVFADTYVELTTVTDPAAGNHLDPYIARYAGLHIVCFDCSTADAAAAELKARGMAIGPVMGSAREVIYGTPGNALFRWFMVPPAIAPEGLFCGVEHVTPEVVYQKAVMKHPNGATALTEAIACVADATEAAARYRQVLGTAPSAIPGGQSFTIGAQRLSLLDAKGWDARFPGAATPPLPALGGYAVRVTDLGKTEALLRAAGVTATRNASRLWVGPADAGGAVLEFQG